MYHHSLSIYSMVVNLSFLSYLSISIPITVLYSFLIILVFFAEKYKFFHLRPILDWPSMSPAAPPHISQQVGNLTPLQRLATNTDMCSNQSATNTDICHKYWHMLESMCQKYCHVSQILTYAQIKVPHILTCAKHTDKCSNQSAKNTDICPQKQTGAPIRVPQILTCVTYTNMCWS